ncbi:hypothetical protein D3C87_1841480 [compost metagenome]
MLSRADELDAIDREFRTLLSPEFIRFIVALIPEEWLQDDTFETTQAHRKAYEQFLMTRIAHSEIFVKEAQNARKVLI